MTIPAIYKFINWVTGTPVPIDDAITSAITPPVDPSLRVALANYVTGLGANLIINPDAAINQRGSQSTANATYGGPDRFLTLTQTASITCSQGTNGESGMPFFHRINQDQAAAQRMGRSTILEDAYCIFLRNQPSSLTGRIRCSASQVIRYAVIEWISTVNTVTQNIVNDWTSSNYTVGNFFIGGGVLNVLNVGSITPAANTWTDITSISQIHTSTLNNLIVFIWTEQTAAQNVTLDFRLKIEILNSLSGNVTGSTPWRPVDIGLELIKCKRYLYTLDSGGNGTWYGMGAFETATRLDFFIAVPVTLRPATVSVVTDATATNFVIRSAAGAVLVTCSNFNGVTGPGTISNTAARFFIEMDCNGNAGAYTAGQVGLLQQATGANSPKLYVVSEM